VYYYYNILSHTIASYFFEIFLLTAKPAQSPVNVPAIHPESMRNGRYDIMAEVPVIATAAAICPTL
jgi:hypothetical protein